MKDVSWVGTLKTSTALGAGLLTLLACGAFACTEVSVDPVGVGGNAGGISNGGSSGSVGRGGSHLGNGGSSGADGTAGTGGEGGSSGTVGNGGTSSGTGGTGGTGLLPDGGDPGPINLIAHPDFETGLGAWTMIAQAGTIVLSTDCDGPEPEPDPDAGVSDAGVSDAGFEEPQRPHGLQCGRGTGRSANYQGPAYPLTGVLARGQAYTVSAYGRIAKASTSSLPPDVLVESVLKLTMRAICQDAGGIGLPILYDNVVPEQVTTERSDWLFMTGQYIVPGTAACPVMTDLRVYIEGPPGGIDILVDDVSIYEL